MKTAFLSFRRGAWALGMALVFVAQAVQACPGCKQVTVDNKTTLNGASIGFGLGVLFMIAMVVGVLSTLGYVMYRYAKVIAAQQQEMMDREDALRGAA